MNRNKLRAPPHAGHSSTRSRTSTMASMAMPVMGATAVASRVSVRAKSNFHGARVAGVKPVAPRPAAVQTRASARAVEQADDLQLGQVRRWQPPNILAIERDPSCFYRPTRGRGARPIRRRWPVPARTAVPETRSPRRGIARARARSRRARVAVSSLRKRLRPTNAAKLRIRRTRYQSDRIRRTLLALDATRTRT